MMKRITTIGFATLFIMSMCLVIDIVPVMEVSANDPVWNVDHWETTGDWNIDATTTNYTYTSTTIYVNGNLTITPGYTLTLQNVDLRMNCSVNGEFNITVQSGGSLIIEDLDADHLTTADRSIIRSYTPGGNNRFGFHVDGPSGYIEFKNSQLQDCGWSNVAPDWKDAGLNIQSPNAVITGNELMNGFRGLILHNITSTGATVSNNSIHTNQATGLWISSGSTNNHIADNEIYSNQFGILINSSVNSQTNYIINNNIHDNGQEGIILEDSTNFLLKGNSLDDNLYVGIDLFYSTNIRIEENNILNHTGTFPNSGTGVYIWESQDITVHNNYFDGNGGTLQIDEQSQIYSEGTSQLTITDNYFTNSGLYGMRVHSQTDVVAENNTFEDNLGNGAIMIFLDISDFGLVNNNLISNAGWTGIIVGGGNNFKVTNNTVENIAQERAVGIFCGANQPTSTLKAYVYNNQITNIGSQTEGSGLIVTTDRDHIVDGNIINDITSHGMVIEASDTLVQNNVVSNVGSTASASNFEDVSGIALAGNRNTLINNTIQDCQSPVGTYPVSGLQFGYSTSFMYAVNTVIKDSYIYGNEINVRAQELDGSVRNVTIENTTIVPDGDTADDFLLNDDAHLTTINTTFDNTSVSIDSTSNLTVKWFLDVHVVDGGSGVNGAVVKSQNLFGTTEPSGQTFTTQTIDSEDGWVKDIPLTEFVNEGGSRVDYTNHWVNVTNGPDIEGLARPKMFETRSIEIELNERPVANQLMISAGSVLRGDTIEFSVDSSDLETSESNLEAHFEYRDSNDFAWNVSYLTNLVYDGSVWREDFTPATWAPLGLYDVRVRMKDAYGSFSHYKYSNNSVLVENNPPVVEDMYNDTSDGNLDRGDFTWVYADGQDPENGDDQNHSAVEFEYNDGSGWDTTFLIEGPVIASNNWRVKFEPSAFIDTETGIYQFRVRFQDQDGTWSTWENLENLNVLNNPPDFEDFSRERGFVYRDNKVRVYVNASDIEELEEDLDVHFYYEHSILGGGWQDTWLTSNGNWHSTGGFFYADFEPPSGADIGVYKFRVEITDHDTGIVTGDTTVALPAELIEVKNNLPNAYDIDMSQTTVRAGVGEIIYVHVYASDIEDGDSQLQIQKIEWRANDSESPGVPPTNPAWITDPGKLSINDHVDFAPGGYLRGSIEPKNSAYLESYDIRASVVDTDTGKFQWIYMFNAFTVSNPIPVIDDIRLQSSEVFRGDTVYITLNATDPGEPEGDLTVYIEYKKQSSSGWTQLTVISDFYDSTGDGQWKIPFTPDLDWDDDNLGTYKFQGMVENSVKASSAWLETSGTLTIKNNKPVATLIGSDITTMMRTESATIYANGNDIEDLEGDLDAVFEYSTDGNIWHDDDFDGDPRYSSSNSRWEVKFVPDAGADLGSYHFRVTFHDGTDYSDELDTQNLIHVSNSVPIVTSLTVSATSEFRMQPITLTALVSDTDHDADTLIPNFQYQGPSGGFVSQDDSNYFSDSGYDSTTGRWEITFTPPSDAEVGIYTFQVQFTDDDSAESTPFGATTSLDLKNSLPTVTIDEPTSGTHKKGSIKFEATGYDDEDSSPRWHWDFGDGEFSEEESPSHEFSKPGDYTITVTITDSDEDTATDTVTVTISEATAGMDMMMLILVLLPFIILVLVLVVLLTRKKKKPEDIPPEVPEAGAPAPAEPEAPQAVAAPPPAAEPTAAPAAVPAAAPAPPSGGQSIKCPKCGTPFTVTDPTRPITIECPNCHAKGTLS
jgi:parallel beta-helix repeat protein